MTNTTGKNNGSPANGKSSKQGFLPITTNLFDRVFISIVMFIAINLLWMRFLEAMLPLTVASVISLIVAFLIIRFG